MLYISLLVEENSLELNDELNFPWFLVSEGEVVQESSWNLGGKFGLTETWSRFSEWSQKYGV